MSQNQCHVILILVDVYFLYHRRHFHRDFRTSVHCTLLAIWVCPTDHPDMLHGARFRALVELQLWWSPELWDLFCTSFDRVVCTRLELYYDFMYCIIILSLSYLVTWLLFLNKPIDWLIEQTQMPFVAMTLLTLMTWFIGCLSPVLACFSAHFSVPSSAVF